MSLLDDGRRTWEATIREVLQPVLRDAPDRDAVIWAGGRLTYAELDREINAAVAALHELGVRKGDRVAVTLPNRPAIIIAFHAVTRSGAVWLGISKLLAAPEKAYMLEDAGADLYLADPASAAQLGELAPAGVRVVVSDGSNAEWEQLCRSGLPTPVLPDLAPEDLAAIAYTSGTTGFPKGVMHSHHNLLVASGAEVATRGYGPDTRKVDSLALTILNVLTASILIVEQAGGTHVLVDSTRPADIAAAIRDHGGTMYQGVPATYHGLLTDPDVRPEDLASLRELVTGGAATSDALQRKFAERFGKHMVGNYGLTEGPIHLTMDEPGGADHRPGASGRAVAHVEVFAADDDDRELPPGEVGEICVRPARSGAWAGIYTPMLGYWGNPDASAAALRGGVLHTGDLGYVDEDGYLFVVDRKNALIVRGGANVYPAEVERVLLADERVADCAVLGVPHERLGERVVALVQVAPGVSISLEELREMCAQHLARYKVPEEIRVVDSFPRNALNKIVRSALVATFRGAARP